MPLIVYNKTASPVTLAAGNPARTVPASPAPPGRGPAVDVTSELRGLSASSYDLLVAQVAAGTIEFEWTGRVEYPMAGTSGNVPAPTPWEENPPSPSGAGSNIFIYAPNHPDIGSGQIYGTWAEAWEARQAFRGPAVIEIDDTHGSAEIPAGGEGAPWPMDGTALRGRKKVNGTSVACHGSFRGLCEIRDLYINAQNTLGPILQAYDGDSALIWLYNTTVYAEDGNLFYARSTGGFEGCTIYMDEESVIDGDGNPIITVEGFNSVTLRMAGGSEFYDDGLDGSGSAYVEVDASCYFDVGEHSIANVYVSYSEDSDSIRFNPWDSYEAWDNANLPQDVQNAVTRQANRLTPVCLCFPSAFLPESGVRIHEAVPGDAPLNVTSGWTHFLPRRSLTITRGVGGPAFLPYTVYVELLDGTEGSFTMVVPVNGSASSVVAAKVLRVTTDEAPIGTTEFRIGPNFSVGCRFERVVLAMNGEEIACGYDKDSGTIIPSVGPDGVRNFTVWAMMRGVQA